AGDLGQRHPVTLPRGQRWFVAVVAVVAIREIVLHTSPLHPSPEFHTRIFYGDLSYLRKDGTL
ncbi:MAG: hypothetical protein ACXVDA_22575, partial [Ktedonobacterales bacterium]